MTRPPTKESRDRASEEEIDLALASIMSQSNGRRFLYWLLGLGHLGANPFTSNALTTAFACGELNVAQQLQSRMIDVSASSFTAMLVEMENERLELANDQPDQS